MYELNDWSCNPTNNVTLKNCFFGTGKLVRNAIKKVHEEGSWSFGNDFSRNVVIFGVDNS